MLTNIGKLNTNIEVFVDETDLLHNMIVAYKGRHFDTDKPQVHTDAGYLISVNDNKVMRSVVPSTNTVNPLCKISDYYQVIKLDV